MFLVYSGQRHTARLAAAGLSAVSMILIIGCSSGSHSSSATAPPSPRQAILAAATRAQQVTSADEMISVRGSGAQSVSIAATVQMRLKPTLEASEDLTETGTGPADRVKLIITGNAIYLSEPSLTSQLGKPWGKIGLSALKGTSGASFAQLWQDLQNNDFANQTQLLTVAKNAHVVGTQTIGGVPTTEYAGSFTAAEGLKALPGRLRSDLSPQLKAMGNTTIHFRIWLDGQHQARKLAEVETIKGETINTTVDVTAINPPVGIVPPPARQTADMSKS